MSDTAGTPKVPVKSPATPATVPSLAIRAVIVGCGLALLAGFFMPWFKVGNMLSVTGVGLVFTQGDVVGMLSGPNRFLLIAVPVLGALLLVCGGLGYRVTSWVAVIGASVILIYGLFTVMQLFISSTGLGMWLVILASIASLGIGLFSIGRRTAD